MNSCFIEKAKFSRHVNVFICIGRLSTDAARLTITKGLRGSQIGAARATYADNQWDCEKFRLHVYGSDLTSRGIVGTEYFRIIVGTIVPGTGVYKFNGDLTEGYDVVMKMPFQPCQIADADSSSNSDVAPPSPTPVTGSGEVTDNGVQAVGSVTAQPDPNNDNVSAEEVFPSFTDFVQMALEGHDVDQVDYPPNLM